MQTGASPSAQNDPAREMLRHTLATLAYRCVKSLREAPEAFATFQAGARTRTPAEILAHIGDLIEWGLSIAEGKQRWHDSKPLAWPDEVTRLLAAFERFDSYLRSGAPMHVSAEMLFQGPVADALTHVGQINLLRRLFGAPVRGENYYLADIRSGRVGDAQSPPTREFDEAEPNRSHFSSSVEL